MTDLGKTASLQIRVVDLKVVHMYALPVKAEYVLVSYTIRYHDHGPEYPGSVVLPREIVEELHLEIGDTQAWLRQKTRSQHHEREEAKRLGKK